MQLNVFDDLAEAMKALDGKKPDHMPLPAIDDLRAMLSRDPYIRAVEAVRPHTIKQLPLRIINSSIDATYHHLLVNRGWLPGSNTECSLATIMVPKQNAD